MKQFQYTTRFGEKFPPVGVEGVIRSTLSEDRPILYSLPVGQKLETPYGSWERLPDLVLQDDVPLTAEDVAMCRESAQRVHSRLRLERIATAAMEGIVGSISCEGEYQRLRALADAQGLSVSQWIACDAVKQAHALIAELDKQS